MMKKSLIAVVLMVGLMVMSGSALAQNAYGPGMGQGYMMSGQGGYGQGYGKGFGHRGGKGVKGAWNTQQGYGQGRMGGWGPVFTPEQLKEIAPLKAELYKKNLELRAVMAGKDVDAAQAKSLMSEMTKLRGELAAKRLEAQIEFRKNNPDYNPGYGRGFGSGPCWQ